jgi:hypothetical protein
MERMEEKVAAHEATLVQMNERIGSIEARLLAIETRLSSLERHVLTTTLAVGGALGVLMSVYKFW